MKKTRTPLQLALLPYLLGNDEPLVGDLVEEWPRRSSAWFWRQVVFAMLAKAGATVSAAMREPQRLTGALGTSAIFLILSFQVGSNKPISVERDSVRKEQLLEPVALFE